MNGCWHCGVDQFWHHKGFFFFIVGEIASAMSYYICWVWLIGIHFQIIYFKYLLGAMFLMQKTWNFKKYGLLKFKNWGVTPLAIKLMDFNLVQWWIYMFFRELVSRWKCINKFFLKKFCIIWIGGITLWTFDSWNNTPYF
jgi:hypothetical protein